MLEKFRDAQSTLSANGYRLDRRDAFEINAGSDLIARANQFTGAWVLWDPDDDDRGLLLVGDNWEELFASFIAERGDWIEGGSKAAISC